MKRFIVTGCIALAVVLALCPVSFAQGKTPVKIVFDRNAERIDLKSGKVLPDYTEAVRGSVEFFYSRLDKPEKGFWYFFDGRRFQQIERLAMIRHMPGLGAWAVIGIRGSDPGDVQLNPMSICEIGHQAVSFVPLNPKTGKEDPRVYVKLVDVHMMQWQPVDHWVAKQSQAELEKKKGKNY